MSDPLPDVSDQAATIPITLYFGGEIPAQGLDADEVAAVAEGMAKAVQFVSGRAVDADRRYTLHLRQVTPGSAIFQFFLEAAAVAQTVLPVLPPGGFSVKEIGEVLSQAVKLLVHLGGKPPAAPVTVTGDNNVVVTNASGAPIIINQKIYQLASNGYMQEQVEKAVKPLKKPRRTLAIQQEDRKLLTTDSTSYLAIAARPVNDDEPLTVNSIEATLRVRQPHLDGEDSWKFGWGRNSITAQIKDRAFMEKVHAGVEEFRAGDVLRVKLRIEEQQRGKNVTKRHYIDEVLRKERKA
jgi:hypothetical protein